MVDCDNKDSRGKAVEELKEKFMEMQSMVSTSMQMFGQRLDNVEEKCKTTSSQAQPVMQPVKFAEIVKKALKEDRESTAFRDSKTETLANQNMLIIKSKESTEATEANASNSIGEIEKALGEIQVTSCRKIKSGGLLMKFPSKEVMNKASHAIDGHLGPDHAMRVTEPKKMLPKMTVHDIGLTVEDEDIIPSILRKNPGIQQLVDKGMHFPSSLRGQEIAVEWQY